LRSALHNCKCKKQLLRVLSQHSEFCSLLKDVFYHWITEMLRREPNLLRGPLVA
jgi:hypothetical protein